VDAINWPVVNFALNVFGVVLGLAIVFLFWRSAHLKADAREILELAKANNQIALDLVSGLRRDARGVEKDIKRVAEEQAQKLREEAARTAAVRADGTVHLPAGKEVVVKADAPDKGP
jgi:NAD(P)H-hydrate repair Nnr-like enzyme with NAD(P)H-hydrate epimerase domain